MSLSRSSILEAGADENDVRTREDHTSVVYNIIREFANATGKVAVNLADILPMVLSRGRTQDDLDKCIKEYVDLNVFFVNKSRTVLRFVQADDE